MSSKMPPQYLFALALALCIAVIALFTTMVVRPRQAAITTMQDELAARQIQDDAYHTAARELPKLKTDLGQQEAERSKFVQALPKDAEFGKVLAQIRANVAASKADLKSLSFANSTVPNLPAGVRANDINMDVSGQYNELFQVLRSLETQSRFTTINNVNLTLPKADSLDPTLEGKYTMTVYTFDPALAAATPGTTPAPGAAGTSPATPNAGAPAASATSAPAAPSTRNGPTGGIR